MSLYTPPPGSGGSSGGGSGIQSLGLIASPSNVLVVVNSPVTTFTEDSNIYITMPVATAASGGYLSAADWARFDAAAESGVVLDYAVTQIKPDGSRTFYVPASDTDTDRGLALLAAMDAQAVGDSYELGPGIFQLSVRNMLATGVAIRGKGKYTTTIRNANIGATNATIGMTNGAILEDLTLNNLGCRGTTFISGGYVRNVYTYSTSTTIETINSSTATVSQPPTVFENVDFSGGIMGIGRFQNFVLKNCNVVLGTDIDLNNNATITMYDTHVRNSVAGRSVFDTDEGAGATVSIYGGSIATTQGGAALNINHNVVCNLYNTSIYAPLGTGVNCGSASAVISLMDCYVSGGLYGLVRSNGTLNTFGTVFNSSNGTINQGNFGHNIMLPASASTNGYLSSGDWSTFNSAGGASYNPDSMVYGHLYFPEHEHFVYNSGNIATGSAVVITTVPTGRKYLFHQCRVFGNSLTAVDIQIDGASLGYIEGNINETRFVHVFEEGDQIGVRGVAVDAVGFYTGATGVNISMDLVSIPSSINIRTVGALLTNGSNTIYTCPANKIAALSIQEDFDDYTLRIVNYQNTSIIPSVHYVPSGGPVNNTTKFDSFTVLPINSGLFTTRKMGGIISAGTSIVVNVSMTGLAASYLTIIEHDV